MKDDGRYVDLRYSEWLSGRHVTQIGVVILAGLLVLGVFPDSLAGATKARYAFDKHSVITLANDAAEMIQQKKCSSAVVALEGALQEYVIWRKASTQKEQIDVCDAYLPKLYFQLARAKETLAGADEDVIAAYERVVKKPSFPCFSEQASTFAWLVGRVTTEEFAEIVCSYRTNQTDWDVSCVLGRVCVLLDRAGTRNSYANHERYYDIIIRYVDNPIIVILCLEACFRDDDVINKRIISRYLRDMKDHGCDCSSKPAEKTRIGKKAAGTASKSLPSQISAASMLPGLGHCSDPAGRSDTCTRQGLRSSAKQGEDLKGCKLSNVQASEEDKLQMLLEGGEYEKVVKEADLFIKNAGHVDSPSLVLTPKAIILKSRAYARLKEIDKAIDVLNELVASHPRAKEVPEAIFLLGYYNMLKGKTKDARELYDTVIERYNNLVLANKAKCMNMLMK